MWLGLKEEFISRTTTTKKTTQIKKIKEIYQLDCIGHELFRVTIYIYIYIYKLTKSPRLQLKLYSNKPIHSYLGACLVALLPLHVRSRGALPIASVPHFPLRNRSHSSSCFALRVGNRKNPLPMLRYRSASPALLSPPPPMSPALLLPRSSAAETPFFPSSATFLSCTCQDPSHRRRVHQDLWCSSSMPMVVPLSIICASSSRSLAFLFLCCCWSWSCRASATKCRGHDTPGISRHR